MNKTMKSLYLLIFIIISISVSAEMCYQETANAATVCGGLNTGSYGVVDDSWSAYITMNYTKPSDSTSSSLWQVKHGANNPSPYNITLPSGCWNAYSDKLVLRMYSLSPYPSTSEAQCYNGSSWVNAGTTHSDFNSQLTSIGTVDLAYDGDWDTAVSHYGDNTMWITGDNNENNIYEEAMWWDIQFPTGAPDSPFIINTCDDLNNTNNNLTAYYELSNDIDCSSYDGFDPIGDNIVSFTGNFNGNGYNITDLTFYDIARNYVGLFGDLNNAEVYNLSLININMTGGQYYTGGLVARTRGKTNLSYIYVSGDVTGGHANAEGVGCLVGDVASSGGYIINSGVNCTVIANMRYTGGLIGIYSSNDMVNNTYAHGDVQTINGENAGGLAGYVVGGNVYNSYSTCSVSAGTTGAGGFIGVNTSSTNVFNSYWDINTSGISVSDSGVGKTTLDMKKQSTYSDWNFDNVWAISNNVNYPQLQWIDDTENPGFLDGDGSSGDPYIIYDCFDLQNMQTSLSSYFELGNNIDCSDTINWNSGAGFVPVGTSLGNSFTGNFNGNNYNITDLYINKSGTGYGLFGYAYADNVEIRNVNLINANVTGSSDLGGILIGRLARVSGSGNPKIINIKVDGGSVYCGSLSCGGVVGQVDAGTIENVSSTSCSVSGTGTNSGGIIGYGASTYVYLKNSYSNCSSNQGGLIGGSRAAITNSYSAGNRRALGTEYSSPGAKTNCYWDETLAPDSDLGCVGKTTVQMKLQSTYVNWDFDNIWRINSSYNNGYPLLLWENPSVQNQPPPPINGSGTSLDPYIITTCDGLNYTNRDLTAYYELGDNIDCSGYSGYVPIGSPSSTFTGNFNGNHYNISNLLITYGQDSGVFGRINTGSVIKNVNVININVSVSGSPQYIAGFVAEVAGGTISNCSVIGTVSAPNSNQVAGFVGYMIGGLIRESYTIVNVSGSGYVGGFVGRINSPGQIINSYSAGTLVNALIGGGFAGYSQGTINYCYNIENIVTQTNNGAFVGWENGGSYTSNYWDYDIVTGENGDSRSGDELGIYNKSTSDMKIQSTYTGWDFDNIWTINQSYNYPELRWTGSNYAIQNVAPKITYVEQLSPVILSSGQNLTANIVFNVTDANVNVSSANLVVYDPNSIINTDCVNLTTVSEVTQFNCSFYLPYYTSAGSWSVNVSINDTEGESDTNTTTSFTINSLDSISINVSTINFGQQNPGANDVPGDQIEIENLGNTNYTTIELKGYDLKNPSGFYIGSEAFCINDIDDANTGCNALNNNTNVEITDAVLDYGLGQKEILYTFVDVPVTVQASMYSSISDWVIVTS